ncbi:MAG: DUF364 domain-containing protein [Bacteroidales bacterium]|jgi:uncharacterized protein (DUF4213/DUF364 family)|nr:DUF364 domain-containing protein [Bacteroidales bacterium]
MNLLPEPIALFYSIAGFDPSLIERCETGEKYAGIMLRNGNIGVCAILGQHVDNMILTTGRPDLSDPGHRIILNAWFNALYNYDMPVVGQGDIFERERFSAYRKIVMIGSFVSLTDKFRKYDIPLHIFDMMSDEDFLVPMNLQPEFLSDADCVILTGTTISNNSFMEVISHTPSTCDIFLLGPSNVLHRTMFRYRNIKVVFGSRFKKYDHKVLDLIRDGHGTRSFLEPVNKVYISEPMNPA